MLNSITLYWLTNTAASSARLYRQNRGRRFGWNQGWSSSRRMLPQVAFCARSAPTCGLREG
jgi:hypothetical protein